MATTSTTAPTGVTLTDPALFRQACYIDGAWVNARSNATINVDNPATGEVVGTVPKLGAAETRDAIEAAERALPAWRKKTAKERAAVLRKWFDLMLQHQDDLAKLMTVEQGKPLAESKGEVAYAAAFLEWFGEEAKRVYGDTHPRPPARQAHLRDQAADWRRGLHHAVELPAGDDHAQGRSGHCRRLHRGAEARVADAVLGAGAGRTGRARRHPEGRVQRRHRIGGRHRQRADVESDREEAVVHRLHRGRQAPDGAVRRHGEEGVARARRQRAVHRVRRRRSRRRRRRRDGVEVPQHRPDLRVREPHLRAGQRLRRLRAEAHRGGGQAESRQRARGRRQPGSADRRQGRAEGRGAHRRRDRQGRQDRRRRQAAREGRTVLRADRAGGRDRRR